MKKFLTLGFLALTLFSACTETAVEKEEEFNFETFGIDLPQGWKGQPLQGIDSYVGRITNGKDTLTFDHGMYSSPFDYLPDTDYIKITKKIDGKDAVIVRPKVAGKGILGVRIATGTYGSLKISGRSKDEEVVLKMFDSIRIK